MQNGDLPDAVAAALFDVRHIGKVRYTRFGAKKRSVSYRPMLLKKSPCSEAPVLIQIL